MLEFRKSECNWDMKQFSLVLTGFLLGIVFCQPHMAMAAGDVTTPTDSALRTAMAGGGLVTISCSGTITLNSPITVSSDTELACFGNVVISGGGNSQLFIVDPYAQLTGDWLFLANGSNNYGGAINNSGTLILNDCILSNNVARGNSGTTGTAGTQGGNYGGNGGNGGIGGNARGGAIFNEGGSVYLNRCVFSTNRACGGAGGTGGTGGNGSIAGGDGGAGANGGQGLGGAVYFGSGILKITNCLFRQNFVSGGYGGSGGAGGSGPTPGSLGNGGGGGVAGGGAVNVASGCVIIGSTFDRNLACSGNSADGGGGSKPNTGPKGEDGPYCYGGGIWANGTSELKNCTFSGNKTTAGNGGKGGTGSVYAGAGGNGGLAFGGGLYSSASGFDTTSFINCTLAGGGAYPGTNGGIGSGPFTNGISAGYMGVSCGDNISTYSGDNLSLDNCILASPAVSTNSYNFTGSISDSGYSLSSDNSPLSLPSARRNKSNLYLGALSNNGGDTPTIPLSAGSCAIDAGNPNVANIRDQRGLCASGTRDVGAYEVNGFAPSKVCIVAEKPFASKTNDAGRFLICRYDDASGDLTVDYSIGGSAINGTHYATIPNTVTIPAGQYWARVNITPLVNTNKTVTLTLSAGGYFDLYGPSTATVTISNQAFPFDPHDTRVTSGGRFVRGTGTNAGYQSFVIPLDFQKGVPLQTIGGNITNLLPGLPLNGVVFHYDAENTNSVEDVSLRIPCQNPIAAFGSVVGGSSIYVKQQYRFGIYAGTVFPSYASNALLVTAYMTNSIGGYTRIGTQPMLIPTADSTNAWRSLFTNGFSVVSTNMGLVTTVSFQSERATWGSDQGGGIILTHCANTNYLYRISFAGISPSGGSMADDAMGFGDYAPLYTVAFENRPANRSTYVDAPQFEGDFLPPGYQGKTLDELTTVLGPATSMVSLQYLDGTHTNLDNSPELRRHPILDQFVNDMGRDPIALARAVRQK
jgi:hypothetical protein